MKRTVTAFLHTHEAGEAARYSGNSCLQDFSPDSDGRVARSFGGAYTVEEVRALLQDLERVQAAYDKWCKLEEQYCGICGSTFPHSRNECEAIQRGDFKI